MDVDLVTTAWCTVEHETLAKRDSAFVRASPIRRARAEWALLWNRAATVRVQRPERPARAALRHP
ncbi:MAG: hypothetical protein U0R64_05960 [Candidatus Nanopelagicales bacterium]